MLRFRIIPLIFRIHNNQSLRLYYSRKNNKDPYHKNDIDIDDHPTFIAMPKSKVKANAKVLMGCADKEDFSPVCYDGNKKSIVIHIFAKPGAKHSNITGIDSDSVSVQIAAPPVDGEANAELVKYFSKVIGVKKSVVCLEKGNRSRNKVLSIQDDCGLSVEGILQKIHSQIA